MINPDFEMFLNEQHPDYLHCSVCGAYVSEYDRDEICEDCLDSLAEEREADKYEDE